MGVADSSHYKIAGSDPLEGCAGVCMDLYVKHINTPSEERWSADIEQLSFKSRLSICQSKECYYLKLID
jgi:hypothetical protein